VSELFSDLDAERTVIGCVLVHNSAMNVLAEQLVAKHFSDSRHQKIWECMLAMYERSQPIDLVTIKAELAEQLEAAGGIAYIASLVDGVPRITNPEEWGSVILGKARRRATAGLLKRFTAEIQDPAQETEDIIERNLELLTKIQRARKDGVVSIKDVVPESMAWLDKYSTVDDGLLGIPCGLADVDQMLGGWQPGCLYIIAARPSRGKSVFCSQSAIYAGFLGYRTLYFGLEMRPSATTVRMICGQAGVDRWNLRRRAGNAKFEQSWANVGQAAQAISKLNIWFDPREQPTIAQIRAKAKQHQAARGCDLLIVDFLQRCQLPPGTDNWIGVAEVARGLKTLAQALSIPVIAACQLNTEAEEKRPTQKDLAQAKQVISSEADVIAFLHPEMPGEWRKHDYPNVTFIVDKQRDGPTGDITLSFERPLNRFISMRENGN
jgi:replicative DNA helicase